ncbi:MAG: ABC-type transport auxiliary lipoprotein family protein [Hyphomicrobiales bacterium]
MALVREGAHLPSCDKLRIVKSAVAAGLKLAAGLTLATSLSACILIAPPPARTFDLSAPTNIEKLSGRAGQLLIVEPSALQALAGSGIVVRPSASELNYFPQAQWADNLPRLLQAKIQESFEATGRTRAIGKPGDGLVIDYQILSSLRAFEFDAVQQSAIVDISVKIVDDRSGRVIGTREFTANSVAASDSVEDAVFALDAAMDEVISAMVRWTLRKI